MEKEKLYDICSFLEIYVPEDPDMILDAYQTAHDAIMQSENVTDEQAISSIKSSMRDQVYSLLGGSDVNSGRLCGFAFCLEENKKQHVLKEVVQEVKEKGLDLIPRENAFRPSE